MAHSASLPNIRNSRCVFTVGSIPSRSANTPWSQDKESPLRWGSFSAQDLNRLHRLRVGIVGLGAIGGAISKLASMLEIGHYKLADLDSYEIHNRSRQIFAKEATYGHSKVIVVADEIRQVHPKADLILFEQGVSAKNIDRFLDDIDIVIDGIDIFQMNVRRMVFNRAKERNIPVVTVAPLGRTIASALFSPEGMSFDQYFRVNDQTPESELMIRFLVGLAPKLMHRNDYIKEDLRLNEKKATTDPRSIFVAAAELANWIERIFLESKGNENNPRPIPYTTQVDIRTWSKKTTTLHQGLGSPFQQVKLFWARKQIEKALSKSP
ncbi:MAG: ThiF family adenylyltransferase [Bdellovibrionales bacterium]|nr:ThiF family adenylyltransferase [Bdellovibrionales bacterium]